MITDKLGLYKYTKQTNVIIECLNDINFWEIERYWLSVWIFSKH